jgi:hypothetical protein
MNNYEKYIDFLKETTLKEFNNEIENSTTLPMFNDLKNLANHYKFTLEKFANCSNEYAYFIERMEYDNNDFDNYQDKFKELKKIDNLLIELDNKNTPNSIKSEVENFINSTYSTSSLYRLNTTNIENEIYAYHNKTTDVGRMEAYQEKKEKEKSNGKITLIVIVVIIILISIFN